MKTAFCLLAFYCLGMPVSAVSQEKNNPWLKQLLYDHASPLLKKVLDHPDSFHYQIIYTQINRNSRNIPSFQQYYLHVDRNQYYNPASTVKLPVALTALEKLHAYRKYGIGKFTTMLTDSSYSGQTSVTADSSAENNLPSVAHYVKKIFLVSDNDAYNRLYEFNGQQYLNETLWKKGYRDVRIVRRFVPMSEEENRHTNSIRFMQKDSLLYSIPPAASTLAFDYSRPIFVGNAHWNSHDSLVHTPMDFTRHNQFSLEDLQYMLQSVIFPASVPKARRFDLSPDDRTFLLQYMSELPSESRYPHYDSSEFFDSYAKFFLYKSGRQKPPPYIRIFNKPGWSYGYLTDAAYIVDFEHNIEFMISANIYVNRDGVLNDNKYEYDETGYPFFKEIGEIIYQYELQRQRKYQPDLGEFRMNYGNRQ
ncbi:MAG TPA: serine hydrolase [Sediminibacterium sp.]